MEMRWIKMSDGKMEGDSFNIPEEEVKPSLINIRYRKDWITLDLRCRQIRYLKDIKKMGEILFLDISRDDVDGYEFLFKEDKPLFFKSLKEDLESFLNIKINVKDCEVMK